MNTEPSQHSRSLPKWLLEPTVHFFLLAALIFLVYGISQSSNVNELEINQREIDARIFMQELSNGEELNQLQRDVITQAYIEEQILVREAKAMGLDNDARIDDLLAQKMRHVLSGDVIQPNAEELEAYYRTNLSRYETLPTVTVDELVFDSGEQLSAQTIALLQQGADTDSLLSVEPGNSSPLPRVNHTDLSNIFSAEFADQVFAADVNTWTGPYMSNRGQHWLRITTRTAARSPSLDEVVDRVRLEWIATEEESRLQEAIQQLSQQYSIVISNDDDS